MGNDYYEDTSSLLTLLVLPTLIASASFYFQALVTEERFVPALNVISKRLRISDDVAGATLMAAGASSPELFAALTSVFITHSALGIGTVVGSEIFNQLAICAGAVLASKNKKLVLDPICLFRDISFYTISLIFLYNALLDRRVGDDNVERVYIQKFDAYLLVGWYIVYVLVCANYDRILYLLRIDQEPEELEEQSHYEAFETTGPGGMLQKQVSLSKFSHMPFVRFCGREEPSLNFKFKKDEIEQSGTKNASPVLTELYVNTESERNLQEDGYLTCGNLRTPKLFLLHALRPSSCDVDGMEDLERGEDGSFSMYLWQRSTFYDKAKIDVNAWQLRWFTFTDTTVSSVPYRAKNDSEEIRASMMPRFETFSVDESRLMLNIKTEKKDYVLLSPCDTNFVAAVSGFEECLEIRSERDIETDYVDEMEEVHSSLVAFPSGSSITRKTVYFVLLPLNAFVHFFIPDVRNGKSFWPEARAAGAILTSMLALTLGSYAMVESLDDLADILGIPESIVGVTVAAAGTSLPNLISSQCAARLGLGNMAISNVFGSNTYNILVGLGLPWLIYTTVYGVDYNDLPTDGIDESMIVLALTLFLFIGLVVNSGCQLLLWHAYLFNTLYAIFVIHFIGKCYL